jgi:hypothetical protein
MVEFSVLALCYIRIFWRPLTIDLCTLAFGLVFVFNCQIGRLVSIMLAVSSAYANAAWFLNHLPLFNSEPVPTSTGRPSPMHGYVTYARVNRVRRPHIYAPHLRRAPRALISANAHRQIYFPRDYLIY